VITTEQRSQALALQTGLAMAGQKKAPISAVTFPWLDQTYRLCQYPDSFCLFRLIDGLWTYESCTCKIARIDKDSANAAADLLQSDRIIQFPDFYDRSVMFAFYGDRLALFVNRTFKGFLASDDKEPLINPDDEDSITIDCIYIHADTTVNAPDPIDIDQNCPAGHSVE
jgi:hypothetical protein